MYTMRRARAMLSQLVKEAAAGKEVIIARGKLPVARLVPIKPVINRKPGTLKGTLKAKPGAFDVLGANELKMWGIE